MTYVIAYLPALRGEDDLPYWQEHNQQWGDTPSQHTQEYALELVEKYDFDPPNTAILTLEDAELMRTLGHI